jgi:FkbM family methyltransferase
VGLRSELRRYLVRRGVRLPRALVREGERVLHETLAGIRPGMTVVDIGAHRGETASAFAARGATVYAFEPNPDIFPLLEAAARRDPRIRPQQAAVLDEDGEMRLYLHRDYRQEPEARSESSSLIADKPGLAADDWRTVEVRDVAGVVAGIGAPIDVMKIDAEGAEYRILARLIATGAVDRVGVVHVEPHVDRMPGLAAEAAAVAATIADKGLGGKIRFDWA